MINSETLNYLVLEKVATEEKKHNPSWGQRLARGVGGATLGTVGALTPLILGSRYSTKALLGGRDVSAFSNYTNQDARKMDRIAKNHGFVRSTVHPDAPSEVAGTWRNPKTGKSINLSHRQMFLGSGGPHFQAGMKDYKTFVKDLAANPMGTVKEMWNNAGNDGIIRLGTTNKTRSTPILAHEVGHALQGKKMIRMNMLGKPLAGLGALGVLGANALEAGADPETVDKVQKGFAAAGTLGGLGLAASEAHASWLGSKGLRPKLRLKSFVGLPSYLGLAAAPAAAYYANKKWRDLVGSKD